MKMIDVNDKIRTKVEALPDSPGVYRWKDKDGRVIYVGKAKNLKNRVRSYVREDKNRSPKVAAMIRHAEDLDITMTATEMEALILECNLIKEIHPKYNISLRDDKSYPYVKITTNEEWPRIFVTRNIRHDDGARYFGPFTDVGSLRTTLSLLRRYYPIRNCRSMKVSRPCLQYHLHLCAGPCFHLCSREDYDTDVHQVPTVCQGDCTVVQHTPHGAIVINATALWNTFAVRGHGIRTVLQYELVEALHHALGVFSSEQPAIFRSARLQVVVVRNVGVTIVNAQLQRTARVGFQTG